MSNYQILLITIWAVFAVACLLLAMYWLKFKRAVHIPDDNAVLSLLGEIRDAMAKIPEATVNRAIGRTNVERGAFGELVSFLRLKAEYDKIIPFHDAVDFIGIKYAHGNTPGAIDFIDIKTGQARLSKEQIALRKIIQDKNVNFIKITLTIDDCIEKNDAPSTN